VTETSVRFLRPARLDDELLVTAEVKESGRASLIIAQQALDAATAQLLCEGAIRIGWVDSALLQPARIPTGILEALKNR
jgi:acyl-CoA thioester hydrolase